MPSKISSIILGCAVAAVLAGCGGANYQSNRVRDTGDLRAQNKAIVLFTTVALHPHTKRSRFHRGKSPVSPTFLPVRLVDGKYRRDPTRKYFGPYLQSGKVRPYRIDAGAYLLVNAYYRFTDQNQRVTYRGPVFANRDGKFAVYRFSVKAGEVIDLGRLEIRLTPPLNRPRMQVVSNPRSEVDEALKKAGGTTAKANALRRRLKIRPLKEIPVKARPRMENPS